MKIYNTLTRKKEKFKPLNGNKVTMYLCGPTVYDAAHLGHGRSAVSFDIVRRYLMYKGYDVNFVSNYTDIDDKMINRANEQGISVPELAERFIRAYEEDVSKLRVRPADVKPRATEHNPQIIKLIEKLLDNNYAYVSAGDVYYDTARFADYGKLSHQKQDELLAGARVEPGEKKRSPLDFALWKKAKPGEPSWESPWGQGRPGWHIECSAMSSKYLGLPFDIHGGGMDLRFPHHENEIAQAEAATGKSFAKYWIHSGLLTINGDKMSKSLGNMVNICDILKQWNPETIRFFFAQTHYRHPPDFNETALKNAEKSLTRLYRLKERLEEMSDPAVCVTYDKSMEDEGFISIIQSCKSSFEKAMDDDFNTPEAIAVLFEFTNAANKYLEEHEKISMDAARKTLDIFLRLGNVLTLFQEKPSKNEGSILEPLIEVLRKYDQTGENLDSVDDIMNRLIEIRQNARNDKKWDIADGIRDALSCLGFEIQDTTDKTVWRKR